MTEVIPRPENVARLIHALGGERVMLDADLAGLYGVSTKALNQAVKRNRNRFPPDFMFQLSPEEWDRLRSHSVTSKSGVQPAAGGNWSQSVTGSQKHRDPRRRPYAFTEQGVAMLSVMSSRKQRWQDHLLCAVPCDRCNISSPLENPTPCFDGLSMSGPPPRFEWTSPLALSSSKGVFGLFQRAVGR